jgi:hypothetical protein
MYRASMHPDGETRQPEKIVFAKVSSIYTGCLKIKWLLTLYQAQDTGAPSTYLYQGTHTLREGIWTIVEGTQKDPDAVIYQLQLDDVQPPISFLKADDNHLFLLDEVLNVLVGNELFSYTLSRADKSTQK